MAVSAMHTTTTVGEGHACPFLVGDERPGQRLSLARAAGKKLALDRRVADFWPEFAQKGKSEMTLAQLLSHQAGLCALDDRVDLLDYDAVIAALAKQAPLWPPGTAHGYHARTFGFLIDELVRRIAGKRAGQYWREVFAEPLALDIWIGLPKEQNERVATIYAARAGGVATPANSTRTFRRPGRSSAKRLLRLLDCTPSAP